MSGPVRHNALAEALGAVSPDLVFECDQNDVVTRVLSYWGGPIDDPSAFAGKTVLAAHQGPVGLRIVEALRQVERSGKPASLRLRIPWRGGDTWIEGRVAPLGTTGRKIVLVRDVTPDESVRRVLEDSADRFRVLFESSPAPTQIQDLRPEVAALDALIEAGVSDLGSYLASHPGEALRITGSEVIHESNPAMVELLGAADARDLDGPVSLRSALAQTEETAVEWLRAFSLSRQGGTCRIPMLLRGRPSMFQLKWAVPTVGGHLDFSQAVVTFTDISEVEAERQSFEALFESSPTPTQVQDYRPMIDALEQLRAGGVTDLGAYFKEQPEEAHRVVGLAQVVASNPAMVELLAETAPKAGGSVAERSRLVLSTGSLVGSMPDFVSSSRGSVRLDCLLNGRPSVLQHSWAAPVNRGVPDFSRVVTTFADVTEIDAERERVEALFERYKFLFQSSPVAFQIIDMSPTVRWLEELRRGGVGDLVSYCRQHPREAYAGFGLGVTTAVNEEAERLFGVDEDRLLGPLGEHRTVTSETPGALPQMLVAIAEGATEHGFVGKVRRPDGVARQVQVKVVVPRIQGEPDITRVLVSFSDVTELEAEKERFKALFESSPVAMRMVDMTPVIEWVSDLRRGGVVDIATYCKEHPDEALAAVGRMEVTRANPAAADFLGVGEQSMLGPLAAQPMLSSSTPGAAAVVVSMIAEEQGECSVAGDLERADGVTRHAMMRLFAPVVGGAPNYREAVVVFSDVTEIEDARRSALELSDLKSRLIASVSHELRTPLTAVVGFSDLLDTEGAALSAEAAEMASLIASTSRQMGGIVEDLLASAKLDLGDLAVAPVALQLRVEAEATLPTVDLNGRVVEFSGNGAVAWADRGRVRQIVRNLVTNAVRHGDGRILVRTGSVAGCALLRVTDQGSGIPHGSDDLIFEPYWTSGGTAGHTESIGLGLNLSRHLARRMGGDLTYRRKDDRSVFELTLPTEPQDS